MPCKKQDLIPLRFIYNSVRYFDSCLSNAFPVTFHLVSVLNLQHTHSKIHTRGGFMRKIVVILIIASLLSLTSVAPVFAGGGHHHGRGGGCDPLWPIVAALTIPAVIVGSVLAATVPPTYGYPAPQAPETYYAPGAYYAPRAYAAPRGYYAPRAYAAPRGYYAPRAYAAPTGYYAPRGHYPVR